MVDDPNAVTSTLHVPAADDVNVTRTLGTEPTVALPPVAAPQSLPNYEVVSELGRGGMGVVYKARQAGLNRDVALKMVIAGAHASPTERVRFLAEAEAIASVQHSGIIQVFDFGTHDGLPYFAMEYCPGGTLAAKLAGTPIPAREAAALVVKVARAVQAAHDKGIVHRDLKPSNILLTADGEPKIGDFGLARTGESGSGLTQTGAILGSPSYMAPEQAEGKHALVGPVSDVYSIAAILYECLTGRPPFRAATPLDTVMQVIKDDPVPPGNLAAKIPADVETICLKALSKDRGKRYESAAALADDLDRYLAGEPIRARPPGLVEKYVKSFRKRPLLHVLWLTCCVSIGAFVGLMNASNARLRAKQELLEAETKIATDARIEAEYQRQAAARRLEKALDAVDRMMVRVAGEKWALKPELQKERRDVLEEAIGFFQGMAAEDSKDPGVRWQTARANLLAAASMISLAEYDRCREVAATAQAILNGLCREFPDESRYLRAEGEAIAIIGHTHAILAEFSKALTKYDEAKALAERACERDPDDEDNLTFLADAHSSIALFYSFQRPELSRHHHGEVLKIAERLMARPLPSFRARLFVVTANVNLATAEMTTRPAEARAKLDAASAQIPILDRMPPPNGRSAELFMSAKSGTLIYRGLFATRRGPLEAGLADVREGIAILRRVLTIQPKSFPHRIQLLQFLALYADILIRADQLDESNSVLAEVGEMKKSIIKDQPQLAWVENLGNVQRTLQLIGEVRIRYPKDLEIQIDRLLSDTTPGTQYNIACIYAQAIPNAPPEKKDDLATKAVERLLYLEKTTAYFEDAGNIRHLDADTDLDPIRTRDDFLAFRKRAFDKLEKLEKKKPVEKTLPNSGS